MELVHAHQITFDELLNEKIDVLIAACGTETRSRYLFQLSHFSAKQKIALFFIEREKDESYKENENYFRNHGFTCYELTSSASGEIMAVLDTICKDTGAENIKLLVDYSSMTKMWYGTIISYFAFNELSYNNLIVYFSYTPEHFFPDQAKRKLLPKPEPVAFNRPSVNDEKPLAIIIGLGYDEAKVNFLCDFFKPNDVYFFLPNPSFDDNYTQMSRINNRNVLANVHSSHLFNYPAKNLEEIDSKLTSLCLSLRLKHRVIMASLGPKTFSLASFLLNARYPDLEIWNICDSSHSLDLKPAGVPIVYKAVLTGTEED